MLAPGNPGVFFPALLEIEGVRTAAEAVRRLTDKVKWDDGTPTPPEILDGEWVQPRARRDWRDATAIMRAWNGGSFHPTGQCMDFGGTLAAFTRAVGVPSRMLTCLGCAGWNFHVWNEVWLSQLNASEWTAADGTAGVGPASPNHPYFRDETERGTGIYTYDAGRGQVIDRLGFYRPGPAPLANLLEPQQPLSTTLAITTSRTLYRIGETVAVVVTATNQSASLLSGTLATGVATVNYAGAFPFYNFPSRPVTIPAGGVLTATFDLPASIYMFSGDYQITATLRDAQAEARFRIDDGLDLALVLPTQATVGQSLTAEVVLTNTLATTLTDVAVDLTFPPSAVGVSTTTTLNVPLLGPGTVYRTSWIFSVSEPGLQPVSAYVSAGGSSDETYGTFEARGPADLMVLLDVPVQATTSAPFTVSARIRNDGGQVADQVEVNLILPVGLNSTSSLTSPIGTLPVGEERVITWPVTAAESGIYPLRVQVSNSGTAEVITADQLVIVAQQASKIQLELDKQVVRNGEQIRINVENQGQLPDQVVLEVLADNPRIGYRLSTPGTMLQAEEILEIPPQTTRTLILDVSATRYERGTISIRAVSQRDPNAADYAYVFAGDVANIYLPLAIGTVIQRWLPDAELVERYAE